MFNFTKEERSVLIALGFIFLFGLIIHYVFKNPDICEALQIVDSERIYPKIDINKANYEALLRLPGIGPATAQNILHYREEHGPFLSIEDIRRVKGLGQDYSKLSKYFKIKRREGSK